MSKTEKVLVLLRLSMGWIFLYSGISKVTNPNWTSEGLLKGAQSFPNFYNTLTNPEILPAVNFLNEWGQLFLGISLILGIGVRISSYLGAVLMLLYYFPQLSFPYIGRNYYLIDQHIIFALVLVYLGTIKAGRIWGLEIWCSNLPICRKIPGLRSWFG